MDRNTGLIRCMDVLDTMRWFLTGSVFLMLTLLSSMAHSATLYMPDDCANLHACFQKMSPNDTLIIRDGVYTGASNTISHNAGEYPPNGSGNSGDPNNGYTVIRAENDGKVTFDGEKKERLFYLNRGEHAYLIFRGIKFINPSNTASTRDAVGLYQNCNCHHIKFIRVGAMVSDPQGSASGFAIYKASYILLEESYVWGESRYGILLSISEHIIVRRCVVRLDRAYGSGWPISLFQSYDSKYVEWQNNIAIDSDSDYYTNYSYIGSAFNTRKIYVHSSGTYYTEDNRFRGNIALNIHHYKGGSSESSTTVGPAYQIAVDGDSTLPNTYEHNVGWDVSAGIRNTGDTNNARATVKNMTLYVPRQPADPNGEGYGVRHTYLTITDSIIIGGEKYGIGYGAESDYNVIYNTGDDFAYSSTPGANDRTVDKGNAINPVYDSSGNPSGGLKYITRIESSSNLSTIGSGGGSVGATILYRYGESGTLWGETGYNTLTDESLWPFPYEEQIRSDFRTYNPGGTDSSKPDGKRGFCADGKGLYGGNITLTSYIWEYLGNPCPPEICDYEPSPPQNLRVR